MDTIVKYVVEYLNVNVGEWFESIGCLRQPTRELAEKEGFLVFGHCRFRVVRVETKREVMGEYN